MVKNKVYWLLGSAGIVFLFGCSSKEKNTQRNSTARTVEYKMYEQESQSIQGPSVNLDSLKSHSVRDTQHNGNSGIDLSVNPYYDEGYDQGQEDGYNDGVENLRGDSYDDSCRYKGEKRKEYEQGYEEGYEAGFDDGFVDSDYDSEDEE